MRGGDGGAPSADVPQTSAELDAVQRQTAATIIGVAKGMAIPPRGWVVALATAMQESQMGTVGMDVAVDHDSLGVFQQRPSQGWGSPEQVRDPVYATRTFLERLLTVPGWDTMPVTRAAQIVQRSAFPNAYAKWESLANSLVTDLAGVTGAIQECVPAAQAGPGPAAALPPGVARTAIEFATAETGKPYVWGATGPSSYDCSGLMLRAYERAGIVLPRVSRDQYNAGAHVAGRAGPARRPALLGLRPVGPRHDPPRGDVPRQRADDGGPADRRAAGHPRGDVGRGRAPAPRDAAGHRVRPGLMRSPRRS